MNTPPALESRVEPRQLPADAGAQRVRLHVQVPGAPGAVRIAEPVTVGVPFPAGMATDECRLALSGHAGPVPVQARVLERWPDGSIRWALVDFQASAPAEYDLGIGPSCPPVEALSVRECAGAAEIEAAGQIFRVYAQRTFRLDVRGGHGRTPVRRAWIELTTRTGTILQPEVSGVEWETIGPLRSVLAVRAAVAVGKARRLDLTLRLHFFSALATVRFELAVTNPSRAEHPGNFWELGDAGSVLFRDLAVRVECGKPDRALYSLEPGRPVQPTSLPFELYQDSSGGDNWNSRVHVNRDGVVPLALPGYRVRANGGTESSRRATPIAWSHDGFANTGIAVRHFWQNSPKALEADGAQMVLRLFPHQFGDLHEIQGGERKTHVFHVAFDDDRVSTVPLDWVRRPAVASADPSWYSAADAVPYLAAGPDGHDGRYQSLIDSIISGPESFEARREFIDEYGWRNFGDIYADHEGAYGSGPRPIVSHYNNQYDAIAGFAHQFLLSADARWWAAMEELAWHVRDVDIYHTAEDKSGYCGGLFWHTAHYVDAGRSTHRCYPKAPTVPGGGPSNEHAYSTGLMLHYFLTGERESRDAAIALADWIIRMDDGRTTPFRFVSSAATGLASKTYSPDYHGPGRGAGNSIVVLLNAYRLTGRAIYLETAEALVRRCVHPLDDITALRLSDPESRWSYTVFFQALGRYLDEKILRREDDAAYAYAQASLLHYARWMAEHEYLYLEKPEVLEYPTETWAAQDLRKSDVLLFAAKHADGEERQRFLTKAHALFDGALRKLLDSPTRFTARPRVILLGSGFMRAAFTRSVPRAPKATERWRPAAPQAFTPQRAAVKQRIKRLVLAGTAGAVVLIGLFSRAL